MDKKKFIDLALLLVIATLATLFSLFFRASFFVSTLLFFGFPSLYLSFKNRKAVKKSALFAFLISFPLTFIFDYLISVDRGWYIVGTLLNFRLFGIVAVEQFVWSFFWINYIILFYEYFLNRHKKKSFFYYLLSLFKKKGGVVSKRMEFLSLFLFIVFLAFVSLVFINPLFLRIGYAYFWLGLVFGIIPLSIFLIKFPNFLLRFSKITAYFFVLAVIVEYVGLKLNHWTFPGNHYLGILNFFGFKIPFEEVFLYFLVSTPAILAYYEFFDDDRK